MVMRKLKKKREYLSKGRGISIRVRLIGRRHIASILLSFSCSFSINFEMLQGKLFVKLEVLALI